MIVITNNNLMGRNILFLRQKQNLSQDAFAQLIGMDVGFLDDIERGTRFEIDAKVIDQINRLFGVSIYSLM